MLEAVIPVLWWLFLLNLVVIAVYCSYLVWKFGRNLGRWFPLRSDSVPEPYRARAEHLMVAAGLLLFALLVLDWMSGRAAG